MAWILISTILMALAGLAAYLFFQRSGQFENVEDIKFQMFRQEHEEAGSRNRQQGKDVTDA